MAVGDPLGKNVTYGNIEDSVRLEAGIIDSAYLTPQLFLSEISLSVMKVVNILNGLTTRFYGTKNTALTLSGMANPYIVDITGITAFPIKIIRVTHVTTGGVRSKVVPLDANEGETQLKLNDSDSSGIHYVDEGDSLEVWAGSAFTIVTATDKIHVYYQRQPQIASATRSTYIDVLDIFAPFVIQDVMNKMTAYRDKQPLSPNADMMLANSITGLWNSIGKGKSLGVEERP